jgi:hypothetical protein
MGKPVRNGGQHRSIKTICGKVFEGSVREANNKYKIHLKYCKDGCVKVDIPAYQTDLAFNNGLKQITGGKDNKSSIYISGEKSGTLVWND